MKLLSKDINTSDTETKDTCNNDKYHTPEQALKILFGYDSFRAGQKSVIDSILAGRDAFAVMPTGAGKSVCYQIPAVLLPGITLVISPLISLMQDQVKALNEAGVQAAFINSSLSEKDYNETIRKARQGTYKIIYIAPERLVTEGFLALAKSVPVSMVTVDEAHCISQWGQDFRPSYMKIVEFVKTLEKRPIISAFTATATETVREDIICTLGLQNPFTLVNGFDRENLFFQVDKPKNKEQYILKYISGHSGDSGIIYCATRKNVDNIYELLKGKGISVGKYHAGMSAVERKKMQDDFVFDYTSIVVATNAFGMGIDKSNVRFVIHYNMPQSMENYYQEAGRAGRDGEDSQCIMLFSAQDVIIDKFLLDKKEFEGVEYEDIDVIKQRDLHRLYVMEGYCKTTGCLRNYILNYFGENVTGVCGNCGNCNSEYEEIDMTAQAKWVINCIAETKGRFGQGIVIGTLLGADRARLKEVGAVNYKSYGKLAGMKEAELRPLIAQLISDGYIIQTQDEYSVLKMGDITPLKQENAHIYLKRMKESEEVKNAKLVGKTRSTGSSYEAGDETFLSGSGKKGRKQTGKAGKRSSSSTGKKSTDSLTSAGYELFERLKALRMIIAREEGMPPYIVFSDKTLIDMCEKLPLNAEAMLEVSGVGQNKLMKYGQRFVNEIDTFVKEHKGMAATIN